MDVHNVGGSTPEVSSEHSTDQNEATTKLPLDPKSTELFFEGVTMNSGATRSDFVTEQSVLEETVTELYFEQINFEDYYNELNRPLKEFTTPKELIVSEGKKPYELIFLYTIINSFPISAQIGFCCKEILLGEHGPCPFRLYVQP